MLYFLRPLCPVRVLHHISFTPCLPRHVPYISAVSHLASLSYDVSAVRLVEAPLGVAERAAVGAQLAGCGVGALGGLGEVVREMVREVVEELVR